MAEIDILMPRMGESVFEGTIIKWFKEPGEMIEEEETLLEVATDKVDTELPSPYGGKLVSLLAKEGDVVEVGKPIARIETDQVANIATPAPSTPKSEPTPDLSPVIVPESEPIIQQANISEPTPVQNGTPSKDRFYSPLVLNIARKENLAIAQLENIIGTGQNGRVTKKDILGFVKQLQNGNGSTPSSTSTPQKSTTFEEKKSKNHVLATRSLSGSDEIIEMDRMRKVIAERMLESKRTSAHVTSWVEANVTNIVKWRSKWKKHFIEKEDTVLTYTPIFIHAIVRAIKDYPLINASVEGDQIHVKKDINIGLAVALPNGNLIVPVIKAADQLNIIGLTKQVNILAKKARNNELTPDDLSGGTYTVSNMGSFGNVMGTPIIVQPQIAIMALGAVRKKPAVIETPDGDTIGIRNMMMLSHTYDHRIVDGALGGMFVRRVADFLEKFDPDTPV